MAGYDCADTITNQYRPASVYGTPAFWLRYFSPSPSATVVNVSSSNASSECDAAWDSGGKYIGPICAPTQSRLSSNSYSEGQADAQTFASALLQVYLWVAPFNLPTNGVVYCWLDQEPSTSLSSNYWNGWGSYIDGYNWNFTGTYPLFSCLYCNPCAPYPNCSTVNNPNNHVCWSIWSQQPQKCYTVSNPPPWSAEACSNTCAGSYSGPATQLWQFRIQIDYPTCTNLSTAVDMDVGGGINYANYCFRLTSRP